MTGGVPTDLAADIDHWARRRRRAIAVRDDEGERDYEELAAAIEHCAGLLAADHGVGRGERVAYVGLNRAALLVTLYACSRLGAAMVVCNWRLTPAEIAALVGDARPRVLLGDDDMVGPIPLPASVPARAVGDLRLEAGAAPPAPRVGSLDDVVLIVYTSGTTGSPKGAMLTQRAVVSNAANSVYMHDLTADDHVLTVLPMFHVGGLNIQTTPALRAGATVTIRARFDPGRWLADVERLRPTLSVLVPAMMAAVIDHPEWPRADLSSLRMVATGSTFVPVPLIEAFHERRIPVAQVYGSTETSPIAVCQTATEALQAPGATGTPPPGCELRLVDVDGRPARAGEVGEVLVKGDNLFAGYWQRSEATAEVLVDGWYRTGDVGAIDATGQLRISDRLRDVVISGGENIYPAELERVIGQLAAVAEVAVVGAPDARWGERPVAFVVARSGAVLNEDDVREHLVINVAGYKHPARVHFLDSLPRNVMGKVQKDQLRIRARTP